MSGLHPLSLLLLLSSQASPVLFGKRDTLLFLGCLLLFTSFSHASELSIRLLLTEMYSQWEGELSLLPGLHFPTEPGLRAGSHLLPCLRALLGLKTKAGAAPVLPAVI